MAVEPWFLLFPTTSAAIMGGLAVGVVRKRATYGGMAADWACAFVFAGLAFAAALVAGLSDWSSASNFLIASSGAAAGLAFFAAFAGLTQRYSRGPIGSPAFRWGIFSAALGLEGFGWGAVAAAQGAPGQGAPEVWTAVPVAAGVACLLPFAVLASRQALPRAGLVNSLQLAIGVAIFAGGLIALALGDLLMGSALGMAGGGFLYSGTSAIAGLAPARTTAVYSARIEDAEPRRPREGSGVKVRVPKGGAMRMSSFRDDDLPTDEAK